MMLAPEPGTMELLKGEVCYTITAGAKGFGMIFSDAGVVTNFNSSGTPAEAAGITVGSTIAAVNGTPVTNKASIVKEMKAAVTGAAMEFTLKAGGAKKEAAPKPANAGWMFKEPGFWAGKRIGKSPPKDIKKWDRRWFELDGARLTYYDTPGDSEAKGTVDMTTCTRAGKATRSNNSEANFELHLATPDRTYWLRCETSESYELWVDALDKARTEDTPTGEAPALQSKWTRARSKTKDFASSPKAKSPSPRVSSHLDSNPPLHGTVSNSIVLGGAPNAETPDEGWDTAGTNCAICDVKFTMTTRKHHCRQCEKLVCDSCAMHRLDRRKCGSGKADRVCDECVNMDREKLVAEHPQWFPPEDYICTDVNDTSISYSERMWWVYNGDNNPEWGLTAELMPEKHRVENPTVVVPRRETVLSRPLALQIGENQEAFHQQVTATLVNGRMVFRDLNKVVFECDLQGCVVGKVKTKTKAQFLDKGYADVILVDLKVPTSEQLQKWTIYIGGDAGAEAVMTWSDSIEANCNLRPSLGELNNVQLLLSKSCAQCNKAFTGKSPKLECGVCQQNVCKSCAPSFGCDHASGLELGTKGAVCTVCVHKAKADVLEKFPAWVTPNGYVAVEVDFVGVTYCDAAWWEESGHAGLGAITDSDNMRDSQNLHLGSTETALIPELPLLKVSRNETVFSSALKIMADSTNPVNKKVNQSFQDAFVVVEGQNIVIRMAVLTPEGIPFEAHCSLKGCTVRAQKAKKRADAAYTVRVDLDEPDSIGLKYYQFAADSIESLDHWTELFQANSKKWEVDYLPQALDSVPPVERLFHPQSILTAKMTTTLTTASSGTSDNTTDTQSTITVLTSLMNVDLNMAKTRSTIVETVELNNDLFSKLTEFQSKFKIPEEDSLSSKDAESMVAWCIHELRWLYEYESLPLKATERDAMLNFPVYSLPAGVEVPTKEVEDEEEKPSTYVKPNLTSPEFAHMSSCLRAYNALVEATRAASATLSTMKEEIMSGLSVYKDFARTNAADNFASVGLEQAEGEECMNAVNSNVKQFTATSLQCTHRMIHFLAKAMMIPDKISRGETRVEIQAAALKAAIAEQKELDKIAAAEEKERLRVAEELQKLREANREKDEPMNIQILPRLFFTGVANVDAMFVKARDEVATVVATHNDVVEKIAAFKESMPRLDDDDTPSLARCFGALREDLAASGLKMSITVDETFSLEIPAEGTTPEELQMCTKALQKLINAASELISSVDITTEGCVLSIEDVASVMEDMTNILRNAGLDGSQQDAIEPSITENFETIVKLGIGYCDNLAETCLYLRRSFDGTKRQVALLRPRPGWVAATVESASTTYVARQWYSSHTYNRDSHWLQSLQAGPRIRHYYRGKIESGPALQPLAEWYGIGSSRAQENVIVATAEQQHAKDTVSVLEKNLAAAVQSVSSNGGVDQTTRARVRVDKEEEYVNVWLKLLHCDLWVYTDEACKNVFAHMWLGGASVLETTTEGGRKRAQSRWGSVKASAQELDTQKAAEEKEGGRKRAQSRWGSVRASALELDTQKAAESVYTLDVRLGLLPAQGRESLVFMFAFESDELRAEWRRCIYCKTIQSDAVLTVPKVSHPRVSTPLATVIQLQNEEEDGFQEFWAEVNERKMVLKTERDGKIVGQLKLMGCSAKEFWGVGCRIKKAGFAKFGHEFVFGLELEQPCSFGDRKYLVSVSTVDSMHTWIDCMNTNGECQEGESRVSGCNTQSSMPENWVAGIVSTSQVKFFDPKWWHTHGDASVDEHVPSVVKLRPMTLIKVPSIDANFANASKLLTQMSDINEHMIDALELFKFAMSSGEDQTLSSCVKILKQEMRKSRIDTASFLTITTNGGVAKFDFQPPKNLPSPLKEMMEALDDMIEKMDQVFTIRIPQAQIQLRALIKSSSALVVRAPVELKAAGFDMVTAAEKVFALKNNLAALFQLKSIIAVSFKTVNVLRTLLFAKDAYDSGGASSVISVDMVNAFNEYDVDNDGYLSEQEVTAMAETMKCGCEGDALKTIWKQNSSVGVNLDEEDAGFVTPTMFTTLHNMFMVERKLYKRGKVVADSVQMLVDEPEKTTLSRKEMVEVLKSLNHEVTKDMFETMCKRFCVPEEKITLKKFKMVESRWEKYTSQVKKEVKMEVEVQRRTITARAKSDINGHVHVLLIKAKKKDDDKDQESDEDDRKDEKKDDLDPGDFEERWLEVEDRELLMKGNGGEDKDAVKWKLQGCTVTNTLGMPAKMDLARAGHAYVFCLEVATPSTTAHNKLYISADSWDSLVVWRRCFEANSKLKSDFQDDSKTEENVLKGMRLLSKGIKIGTAIGGIAAAAGTGNLAGVVGGLGNVMKATVDDKPAVDAANPVAGNAGGTAAAGSAGAGIAGAVSQVLDPAGRGTVNFAQLKEMMDGLEKRLTGQIDARHELIVQRIADMARMM